MDSFALRTCAATALTAALVVAGCGGGSAPPTAVADAATRSTALGNGNGNGNPQSNLPPFNFEIRTLSNRADLISDGDALVEVTAPQDVPLKKVTFTLNGNDVASAFVLDEASRTFRGVLTGLQNGANDFVVGSNGQGKGRPGAALTITNHARGGPILLGSQTQPWICATPAPVAASGNTPASNASGRRLQAARPRCRIRARPRCRTRTTASSPTRRARLRPTSRQRRRTPASRCRTSFASSAAR